MSRRILPLAFVVVLLLPGCGAADDAGDSPGATLASSTTTSDTTTTTIAPTTTQVPSTTSTSVMVTPTLPPALDAKYPVVLTEGVTGPDTMDIAVWAPEADGLRPIAIVFHGYGSQGIHYADMASLLASQGVVVFAPDYRSTLIPTSDWRSAYRDAECAYRHIRTIASDYGGTIDAPITVVGHSIGASVGMSLVLDEFTFSPDGPFDGCPGDVPRPDHLVALSGCHYQNQFGLTFPFTPAEFGWAHLDANIRLVVGSEDEVCEPWQSQDAETQLIADGYSSVDLAVIDDTDHFSVIFTGYENGPWHGPDVEWIALPNDPGGVAAVEIILDTINN
jgi:dienelactone hydrolase